MKTALVTGHLGFIGQHLTKALDSMGVNWTGFDLKSGQDIRQLDHYVLPDADWCFHLAALTDARSKDALNIMETNVMGTLRVLEQYKDRTIFASSSAVNYITTPYAVSKYTGELLCDLYCARIVRFCNIYGEGGHGVFEAFEKQETLRIAGIGDQIRTYARVERAVAALIEAANRDTNLILRGEDLTVNQIAAKYFPDKPVIRVPRDTNDIIDGRQVYDLVDHELCP